MADVFNLVDLEPNIPPTDFGIYTTMLSASPKFGKSEWCTLYNRPLIYDFEEGTMGKVVYRVPITKWSQVKNYNRQLVRNPDLKEKYRTICFDTVNYALELCKQYIMDQYQSDHPDKMIDTFNKIPYGGGHELLSKEFKNEINKLKRAGYGIVFVCHIKEKVFDKDTESEHSKTVPDLSDRERNLLSAMADFLLLGDFETEIIKAAIKDNNGKVIQPAITETNRILYIRTNEKAESGFRWQNVPEKIPFEFNAFKSVFEEAVMEEIERGKEKFNLSDEKIQEIKNNLIIHNEKERKEIIKSEIEKDLKEQEVEELKDIVGKIKNKAKELQGNGVAVKVINKVLNGNPDKLTSNDEANKILKGLNELETSKE